MFPPFFDVCSSMVEKPVQGLDVGSSPTDIIQFYRASFTRGDSLRDVRLSIALQWAG